MNIQNIPVVTVSYNSPELLEALLGSFRQFYPNPIYVIDGSDSENIAGIRESVARYDNIHLYDFGYNIHHGPGLTWAINNLNLSGTVLFLDSDVLVVKSGMIESLYAELRPAMYGVGSLRDVDEGGFNVDYHEGAVPYLLPACMLCNIEVMREYPLPVKHGSPMIDAMLTIHRQGKTELLGDVPWVTNDFEKGSEKHFLQHDWQGTVLRTGGYHLEEWQRAAVAARTAQPATSNAVSGVDHSYNNDLLTFLPANARIVVEVGCQNGSLARAYKSAHPNCRYLGVEINADHVRQARDHCDAVFHLDIESVDVHFIRDVLAANCWVFGDVLEHLQDPWGLLQKIRQVMPSDGCIVACMHNAQHWSIQSRLSYGDFRYLDGGGLMDKTHMRWFTRDTMLEMFKNAGFSVVGGMPRVFDEPARDKFLPIISMMAKTAGIDPRHAINDALPLQYIIKAVPA